MADELVLGGEVASAFREFPQAPSVEVVRPHLIDTLRQMVVQDAPLVFLEAPEGMGSTTLCAQFAKENFKSTFSLFVKPASKFAYNPDYLRLLLAEQFHPWLTGKPLVQDTIDASEFASILLRVRRKAKAKPIYFVVDGVHQIPDEDVRFAEQIFREILPVGVEPFRFIVSGRADRFSEFVKRTKFKTFQVIKFSPAESETLLADVCGDPIERSQLERLCQGIPGRLWSVRRLLTSGQSAREILELDPTRTLEFVRLEFSKLASLSELGKIVVAVLAFGRQPMAVDDLARIVSGIESEILKIIGQCLFLEINRQTAVVEFRSEGHRKYAEKELDSFRTKALTLQIETLRTDPTSAVAVRLLPNYYQQLDNQRAIVELLSPEHYQRLLQVTQSISALKLRANLGARSAAELKEAKSIFQFALQRSIFSSVGELGAGSTEIAALVALGQPQRALDMAAAATAKESRLGLLAAYSRKVIEQGGSIDPQTMDYIRETASGIDFAELGEQAEEIAADLVFVDQDLAFSIVDASMKKASSGKEKDAAYARLSVEALVGRAKDLAAVDEKAKQRIGDSEINHMLSSLTMIADKFSFDEIVRAAETMEIGRRIYFLRGLVVVGKTRPGVLDVVEYALDQIVGDAGYSPKTKDFSDLAVPLPLGKEQQDRAVRIARRMEGQLGLIEKLATSRDLVELQMRLAHVEFVYGAGNASDRIAETYYDVISGGNLEIKVDCLSIMLQSLLQFDGNGVLEERDGFRAVITKDLGVGLDLLLQGTANQFEVVKGALRALTQVDPDTAFSLVSRLNTEVRRDTAYGEIALSIVSMECCAANRHYLFQAFDAIADADSRDTAIREAFRYLERDETVRSWLETLLGLESRLEDPAIAGTSLAAAIGMLPEHLSSSLDELTKRLELRLEALSAFGPSDGVRMLAASKLARLDKSKAIAHYESALKERASLGLESDDAVNIVLLCISLIVRSYRPLAKFDLLDDDKIVRLSRLIEYVPDLITRANIYCDLVCRIWCEGKSDRAFDVARTYCQPILERAYLEGGLLEQRVIAVIFPAIFVTQRSLAIRLLSKIPPRKQADLLWVLARMVSRKISPYEVWPSQDDSSASLSYAEAVELVSILKEIALDNIFYVVFSGLVKSLVTKESRQKLTGTQRTDLVSSLRELISAKLPDPRNISHEGYVIVAEAQLLRLAEFQESGWRKLVERARLIPNTSDKAFVLLEISECLPPRLNAMRKGLVKDALKEIGQIPSAYDRFERLEYYMQIVKKYDVGAAKAALRQALQLTFDVEQRDQAAQFRRNLVDLAESFEPGYADKVAEMIEDDPARRDAKLEIKKLSDVQKLRRQISSTKTSVSDLQFDAENLPHAAWKNVAALVAGRIVAQPPASMAGYISKCGAYSMAEAYPVLSWYIENAARKSVVQGTTAQNVLPLAEVLLASTEMGVSVIRQAQSKRDGSRSDVLADDVGITVGPNDRSQALDYIRRWLRDDMGDELILCDPYFGLDELEFLQMVLAEAPGSRLRVITTGGAGKLEADALSAQWRLISDQDPPETEVISVLGDSGKGVLHDRWIISTDRGLRLGTSFNSIGRGKLSEISVLETSRVASVRSQLEPYLRRDRIVQNNRMRYSIVEF